MSTPQPPVQPYPPQDAPRATGNRRPAWLIPTIVGIVALLIGVGIGIAGQPKQDVKADPQYQALASQLATAQADITTAKGDAATAHAAASKAAADAAAQIADAQAQAAKDAAQAATDAASRSAALDQREAAVKAREDAVTATEQQVAANTISEGTWTVGADIAPGTYRPKDTITSECYWEIDKSGTNGDDIIQNDIVTGGRPTVTLKVGQDFTNHGCGDWVKQ